MCPESVIRCGKLTPEESDEFSHPDENPPNSHILGGIKSGNNTRFTPF